MPTPLITIQEATDFLLQYSPEKRPGETYTLERMKRLMDYLGNPQNDIPAIHVAGTSGKTSTSYFIRALLEAHGKKTGLTTSPHIVSITERVQVGGRPLDDSTFLAYLNEFRLELEPVQNMKPSYFELLIAFAFWVFKREAVDYMVIEVGLGGLLDATNVITKSSKVCVITPIGLDHTEILGSSVEAIAAQKAGIITDGSQVFSANQESSVAEVIVKTCEATNSTYAAISPMIDTNLQAPLFQQANFQLAKEVVKYIEARDSLSPVAVKTMEPCAEQTPPGRFETYQIGNSTIILDGAHNPQKLAALMASLERKYDGTYSWLVGFIEAPDQKINDCLAGIARDSDDYTFVEFGAGQDYKIRHCVSADQLTQIMTTRNVNARTVENPTAALDRLFKTKQRTIVVSGSLYLVATLRPRVIELATLQQVATAD